MKVLIKTIAIGTLEKLIIRRIQYRHLLERVIIMKTSMSETILIMTIQKYIPIFPMTITLNGNL